MVFIFPAIGAAFSSAIGRIGAQTVGRFLIRSAIRGQLQGLLSDLQTPNIPKIALHHNIPDTIRWVHDHGKQVRYATAVALTRTAKRLQIDMESEVRRVFDRPTSFTQRAFGIKPATKSVLSAELFIKPKQAIYLNPNIKGGPRQQKPFERRLGADTAVDGFWVPGEGVRLTAAGNLTRRQIEQIAAKLKKTGRYGELFVGKPVGHAGAPFGIWERDHRSRGIRPLLIKVPRPQYRKRFDFYGIATRNAGRIFDQEFSRAWTEATRTIKPIAPPTN